MINAKLRFPLVESGILVKDIQEYQNVKKEMERRRLVEIQRVAIRSEMTELNKKLVIEVSKKKDYDIKLSNHTNLESRNITNQIDSYKLQVQKLTAALEICQSALIITKKDAAEDFRKCNPYDSTQLKSLQNKQYKLSNKLSRLC